jgi:anthranilate synthase component 2/putative glutamine amidotransferase
MYRQTTSWWSWNRDAALVPGQYLDMVEAAGGQPLLIPPAAKASADSTAGVPDWRKAQLQGLMSVLDGLVLIGGGDVGAERYRQQADPRNGGMSNQRDDLEFVLVELALASDLPLLAVCRGLQVLNVGLGGDLVQQLPDVLGSNRHQPRAGAFGPVTVLTEEGSTVRRVLGPSTEVLCSHHQAVATLARDLVVTAVSDDGVIEAAEMPGRRFVVGVQWHPEESGDTRLFEALVAAARTTPGRAPVPPTPEAPPTPPAPPEPPGPPATQEHP